VRANRANAAKSTGPRTQAGKARVAGNALSHGLAAAQSAPVSGDVEALAGALLRDVGTAKTPTLEAAARELALAQLDVLAVRAVRREGWLRLGLVAPGRVGKAAEVPRAPAPHGYARIARMEEAQARREARGAEPLKNIAALERYERRALARRKWASRAFGEVMDAAAMEGSLDK
jgi:hypothetical protein